MPRTTCCCVSPLARLTQSGLRSGREMKKTDPRVWHSPLPEALGDVIEEKSSNGRLFKVVVIRTREGRFTVYGYRFDDSDLKEGRSNSVGWFHVSGPSITDSLPRARELADACLIELAKEEKNPEPGH